MSRPEMTIDHPGVAPGGATPSEPARSKRYLWIWATIACALLGMSGVVRTWQVRRHQDEMVFLETCPISLKNIPAKLGAWRLKEGSDQILDPLTMRITGGTDHILKTYVDELTGVSLVVLFLFGPAEPVLPHVPEVCYPSSGYSEALEPQMRKVAYTTRDATGRDVRRDALFRSSVYEKAGGLATRREEVYHSFRLDGNWSPDVGAGRKFGRRNPGVFKLQIQRLVVAGEDRERDNPIDQFLSALVPEIERQIAMGPAEKQVTSK